MVSFVMDLLHSLAIPNLDIRRKVLDLVLGLLTERNVQEVVLYLKKEAIKMQGIELEKAGEYHQMLVQAIHACAVEHPEVAGSVVHLLVDFLGESNGAIACDVVLFVREIMETNPMLRESMIQRLFSAFCQIKESFVCSRALWMLAEYSFSVYEVESAISTIKQSIGDLPFYTVSEERESTDTSKPAHPMMNSCTACSKRSTVLADDAYATHIFATNAAISAPVAHGLLASKQYLRSLVVSGDFHLAAVVACTLTKLVLRLEEVQPSKVEVNKTSAESLLIMVSFLQLGQSFCARHPVDQDSYNRIVICVKLLCNSSVDVKKVWLLSFRQSFAEMLAEKMKIKAPISHVQPDGLIDFYHLKRRVREKLLMTSLVLVFVEFLNPKSIFTA
jgi:coatomer subunit beta